MNYSDNAGIPKEHRMDMSQLMALLIGQGQKWVKEQRLAYRPLGKVLPEQTVAQFSPFFETSLLKKVHLLMVPGLENPEFLEAYRATFDEKAMPLLDFSSFAGITFMDTILLVDEFPGVDPEATLFHELVHAVQYELLGPEKFVELYIMGWINQGFNYAAIPLEMDAYELQNRFEADPGEPFSVQDEVSRSLELMLDD
jgi:hypothetical protein